jgi:hypothetical protein
MCHCYGFLVVYSNRYILYTSFCTGRKAVFVTVYGVYNLARQMNINSVALVRERTIPTERPPLVGEVNASFC